MQSSCRHQKCSTSETHAPLSDPTTHTEREKWREREMETERNGEIGERVCGLAVYWTDGLGEMYTLSTLKTTPAK